jgi:hypothetical protein
MLHLQVLWEAIQSNLQDDMHRAEDYMATS